MGREYSTLEVNRLLPRLRLRQVDLVGVFSNQTDLSPTHAVELFLREELRLKEGHKREVRFKRSHLPARKSLGEFDFGFQPSAGKQVILNLMDMTWLDQAFNVCLLGPTSTGKTMLATILGYEALDRGYDVCFEETDTPVHVPETKDFVPASERRVRDLTRARLVIVDEIGYERLGQAEATLLFGFVSQCAERTSLVVTSNKGFDEWAASWRTRTFSQLSWTGSSIAARSSTSTARTIGRTGGNPSASGRRQRREGHGTRRKRL